MRILYLDTSALVKLYVREEESDRVSGEVAGATAVATSRVAYAEPRAAFARRAREGFLTAEELRRVVTALNADWEHYLCVEVTDGVTRQAGELAELYGLRGFDSLHLASALFLKRQVALPFDFLCFDEKMRQAAQQVLG